MMGKGSKEDTENEVKEQSKFHERAKWYSISQNKNIVNKKIHPSTKV